MNNPESNTKKASQTEKPKESKRKKKAEFLQKSTLKAKLKSPDKF